MESEVELLKEDLRIAILQRDNAIFAAKEFANGSDVAYEHLIQALKLLEEISCNMGRDNLQLWQARRNAFIEKVNTVHEWKEKV